MKNNKLRLKGHIKLTLTDVNTGKKQVREGDNVITDALADIMKQNLLGGVDFSKIFGDEGIWKKWFGGVMLYENAHSSLSTGDYFMEANPVTAHAGMTPIDNEHDDDATRGQASSISFIRTKDKIKLVWNWTRERGNGIIRSMSLCHTDTGSYGNGVDSYHFRNTFIPFEQIQSSNLVAVDQYPRVAGNAFVQYDVNHTLFFYIGEDGWYKPDAQVPYGEDLEYNVTIYIRRLPYTKAGLFDIQTGTDIATDERKFTVETSIGFKYAPSYYFDEANKQLWLFRNFTYAIPEPYGQLQPPHTEAREWSRNTVWYSVIDCENEVEIDSGTIVSDADDLAFLECSADGGQSYRMYYGARVIQTNILKIGDDIYLPMGDSVDNFGQGYDCTQNFVGFKRINLSDQTDQEAILFPDVESETGSSGVIYTGTKLGTYRSAIKQGELAAGFGWVMNGNEIFPCSVLPFEKPWSEIFNFERAYGNETEDKPVIYFTTKPAGENSGNMARYIMASKLVNTTKFNLDDPVEKTMSNEMTVEYTITEEEESV